MSNLSVKVIPRYDTLGFSSLYFCYTWWVWSSCLEFWSDVCNNNLRIMQLLPIRKVDICQQARYNIRISIANPNGQTVRWFMEYFKNFDQNCTCGQPIRWQQNYSDFFQKGFVNLNEFVALTCVLSNRITRLIYFEVTKI